MADPLYASEFFTDSQTIKQEPVAMDASDCAGVPIPRRSVTQRPQIMDMSELQDLSFGCIDNVFGNTQQMSSVFSPATFQVPASNSSYPIFSDTIQLPSSLVITGPDGECEVTRISDTFRMEEDDIFQVDKADLIQGPTLAELNANDETLLDDLSFDDLLLPDESSCYILPDKLPESGSVQSTVTQSVMNVNTAISGKDMANQNFVPSSFPPVGQGFYRETLTSSSVPSNSIDPFVKSNTMTYTTVTAQSSAPSTSLPKATVRSPSVSPLQQKHSTLHELLLKKETLSPDSQLGQSVPKSTPMAISPLLTSRLSSSAPTHLGFEQIWQRREPRPHLLSTGSLAEAGSTSSISTGGVLSPESHEFSHDEGFDSEDDSDHYEDVSSDGESVSDGESESRLSSMSKRERYFWQYNVQAKGPKGQRLVLKTKLEDPHVLNEVMDPVFSPQCAVRGIKHSGKARKGDGNDLTPNPRKLYSIGKELDKLGRLINDMTPVSELPFSVRPKTRKEKNKLASRACRLKKKAQHEANKLKLYGLEQEHRKLLHAICQMKQLLAAKCSQENTPSSEEVSKLMDKVVKGATKVKIAGHTTDFVNKVLDKVRNGVPDGGITEL